LSTSLAVLAKEGKKVLLADTELPTEAMNAKLASFERPADGRAGYSDLPTALFDAVHARKVRGGVHGFRS